MNEPITIAREGRGRPAEGFTRALLLGVLALATSAATALAVPPLVPGVTASRNGNDLVIAWSAPTTLVDGYRVYKASDAACSSLSVLFEGNAFSHTVMGAFQDPTAAMYAVAAYDASGEGPRSYPIYRYPIDLPAPTPDFANGLLVSFPPDLGPLVNVPQLCTYLNGGTDATPVVQVARWRPAEGIQTAQPCLSAKSPFNVTVGEAYLTVQNTADTVSVWGVGGSATVQFTQVFAGVPRPTCDLPNCCALGLHQVSLPWDHDYADLAAIAADIPEAVVVARWDGLSDPWLPERWHDFDNGMFRGLHRATSSDPWSGTNTSLAGTRGQGVVIAVDTLRSWTPRRQCLAFAGGPSGAANVPPVANAGGPYDQAICDGGIVGIWIDGTGSFDPDNSGTLSYHWTTTCAGSFSDPNAALTTASFDCDPCQTDTCEVTLQVTDGLGASTSSTTSVLTRRLPTCLVAGNVLRMSRFAGGPELNFDWSLAPPAQTYVLLDHLDRPQLIPRMVSCGPTQDLVTAPGSSSLELFRVEAFDSPCGTR